MKKKLILLFGILLFIGCKTEKRTNNINTSEFPEVNDEFQDFINQFPEIKLPLLLKDGQNNFGGLKKLNETKYLSNQNESIYILGKIKTSGNYLALICLVESEGLLPIVTTFKLNGEKIQSTNFMIGLCGPDECFECGEVFKIDNKLNVSIEHHSYYFECNENGINKDKRTNEKRIIKNGFIEKNGVIKLLNE